MYTQTARILTHTAVLDMLHASMAKAEAIGQPQCIVIVDASGETLAQMRMTGAKFLSLKSARAKARTAASIGKETNAIPEAVGTAIATATEGDVTRLPGGLPIYQDNELLGGIGVGSGTPEQDVTVATAALEAVGLSAAAPR